MNAKERVEKELDELLERISKLTNFIKTENYNNLSEIQKALLIAQCDIMLAYTDILKLRLKNWE